MAAQTGNPGGQGSGFPATARAARTERWTKAGPIVSGMPQERVLELEEQAEASAGEPGGFSLFGFAVGTLVIAIPLAGFVPQNTGILAALAPVLVFAGLAQFIGGLIAVRKGNTFAGTAFCAYGANNTLIATYYLFQAAGLFPLAAGPKLLLGIELFCFAYISLVLAVAALPVNLEFTGILLALIPGFGLVAVTNVGGPAEAGRIGGYFLILSAGLAFYGASAMVINSSFQRRILPLFSRA